MAASDATGGFTDSCKTADRVRRPFLGVGVGLALVVSLFSVVAFSRQAGAQRPMAPNGIGEAAVSDVPVFQDIAPDLGIALVSEGRWPYGANFVDFDNDGRLDLFFANHGNAPLLLRQDEWGRLQNIAEGSGINRWGDAHGAAWGDYDNDGDLDMYQTIGAAMGTGQKSNQFYRGLGDGTFVDVTIEAGVTDPLGRGRTASWVDYDNDGDLDLFVTNETRTDGQDKLYANM